MRRLIVDIELAAWRFEAFYRGEVEGVVVRAIDGRTVRLPASALREHLLPEGIYGRFEVRFGEDHRLLGLRRLGAWESSLAQRGVRG